MKSVSYRAQASLARSRRFVRGPASRPHRWRAPRPTIVRCDVGPSHLAWTVHVLKRGPKVRERRTAMGQNRNYVTLTIAILGAVKLILQAFGVNIITDQQIDAIGNGVAALITVI